MEGPAYSWVLDYVVHYTPSIHDHPSLFADLLQAIYPKGSALPRRLSCATRRPWVVREFDDYDDPDLCDRAKDEIIVNYLITYTTVSVTRVLEYLR